jgi:poly(ADP-ribose) glycohydrolase
MTSIKEKSNFQPVPKYFSDIVSKDISKKYILPYDSENWGDRRKIFEMIANKKLKSIEDIIDSLGEINAYFSDKNGLLSYLYKQHKKDLNYLVDTLFPFLAGTALEVESLFPKEHSLFILRQKIQNRVNLTRKQCLCLITHMFFGTVIDQKNEMLPAHINYKVLLSDAHNDTIKSIFNYFYIIEKEYKESPSNLTEQIVSYVRFSKSDDDKDYRIEEWSKCNEILCEVVLDKERRTEDNPQALIADFSNKFIGGFFLSNTHTQEDILFINHVELQPAILLSECILERETILFIGAQRYSEYEGYADTYRFKCNFEDMRELDAYGRRNSWITAIDAINFVNDKESENSINNVLREMNKAFIGFKIDDLDFYEIHERKSVSTGNWGTGGFLGDHELKFIIQWLACSRARRKMTYCLFKNPDYLNILNFINKYKACTVGFLFTLLCENLSNMKVSHKTKSNAFEILSSLI